MNRDVFSGGSYAPTRQELHELRRIVDNALEPDFRSKMQCFGALVSSYAEKADLTRNRVLTRYSDSFLTGACSNFLKITQYPAALNPAFSRSVQSKQ